MIRYNFESNDNFPQDNGLYDIARFIQEITEDYEAISCVVLATKFSRSQFHSTFVECVIIFFDIFVEG